MGKLYDSVLYWYLHSAHCLLPPFLLPITATLPICFACRAVVLNAIYLFQIESLGMKWDFTIGKCLISERWFSCRNTDISLWLPGCQRTIVKYQWKMRHNGKCTKPKWDNQCRFRTSFIHVDIFRGSVNVHCTRMLC